MKTLSFIALLTIFSLSFSQTGPNNQDCSPAQDDEAEVCTATQDPWDSVSVNGDKVECKENFDCCLCESITCTNCEGFDANADSSAFGVQNIVISGTSDDPASIECGGDSSCEGAEITGTDIKETKCGGDRSCFGAVIDVECTEECKFECDGDRSCETAVIVATNVEVMACSGDRACFGAQLNVTCSADKPCKIECEGDKSCMGANISASEVESLNCKGENACANAKITITDPTKEFKLECGDGGCADTEIVIIIHSHSSLKELKEISCGSQQGCAGAGITVINEGTNTVEIETWDCEGFLACYNALFILTGAVTVEECKCSDDYGCLNTVMTQANCLVDDSIKVWGPVLECVWYEGDSPEECTATSDPWDSLSGDQIECDSMSDCCLCESITCNNCDEFKADGDFAALGVSNIQIDGTSGNAASIDCSGYSSCAWASFAGTYIKEVDCGGIKACNAAVFDIECSASDPCSIDCEEMSSCEEAEINATNVKDFKCGEDSACENGRFFLMCDTSDYCEIECEGDSSCVNAVIYADSVDSFECGGNMACEGATVVITNPSEDFELNCGGEGGCQGLSVWITVDSVTSVKGIDCSDEYACAGAVINIENTGAKTLTIEKLECGDKNACAGTTINLIGDIEFDECKCGDIGDDDYGCADAVGYPGVPCFPVPTVPALFESENEIMSGGNESESDYTNIVLEFSDALLANVFGVVCFVAIANLVLFWCFCVRGQQKGAKVTFETNQ